MVGWSRRNIPREASSVNLGEGDDYVELEEEEVGEQVSMKATNARRTAKRHKTSLVWEAYEIIMVKEKHGKEVEKAKYEYFGKMYVADSGRGTSHLLMQKKKCEPKHIRGTQGEGS